MMNENKQKINDRIARGLFRRSCLVSVVIIAAFTFLSIGNVFGARLQVRTVEKDGTLGVLSTYRWLVEEDVTYRVIPGVQNPNTQAVGFHKSYMPVVAEGDDTTPLPTLDPEKFYFVSVTPKATGAYSMGGGQLVGNGRLVVYVNALPLPTAQISVFIHEDMGPINNAWDQGERGLEGFRIVLEDAGGRYGMSAGTQMADAYGNVLGTVYVQTCDQYGQNPGTGSSGCLDPEGSPTIATDPGGDPVVDSMVTGPDGKLSIRNLAPGKYGVIAIPPNAVEDPPESGNYVSSSWIQTTTIEGTRVIDAWVKANEPPFFAEFGPPTPHVSIGFVPAGPNNPYVDTTVLTGGATITGQIVNNHLSRPPNASFNSGGSFPHTTPWVGLNVGTAIADAGIYAARANSDGSFSIPNVPPGTYQLVVWDDYLDLLISFQVVTITGGADVTLGEVPVFQWFTRIENWVYYDDNENGFRDDGEVGLPEQAVNLRWRDGSVYQSFPTDSDGFVPFDQVFPFFAWLVAEVDFARFKATGLTVTVDDGGPITSADPWSWDGQLTPQAQGVPTDPDSVFTTPTYRTEQGVVLSQGFQGFLGQTSVLEWGKKAYGPGENGGISGVVFYAVTRAEDDPELAAAEPWEPGIPRVVVNLYAHDPDAPDLKGVLLNSTTTDSWDDSPPENCQYGVNAGSLTDAPYFFRGEPTDCFDGMRVWNQVRPGVFDGGYAFDSIIDPVVGLVSPIPPGWYVVEVVPPTGYEVIKSQDRNVDFGENYIPSPQLLPPECVGAPYTVPAELTLFPGAESPLAGQVLDGCETKLVPLSEGANAAADFSLFTKVPVSGHISGTSLDDTAVEFRPGSPNLGEKFAPPWLPISIRDWTGRIITTTYSDEFGAFNALVPSTYTANLAQPSGMSPNMLTACMNDLEADTVGGFYNKLYSTTCYTLNYMPGTTTYLDTPVIPISAFVGEGQNPLDCEFPNGTPRIYSVTNASGHGPYLPSDSGSVTITSVGPVSVANPGYDGAGGVEPVSITRDYGFGTIPGSVTIGGVPLTNVVWSSGTITGSVGPGTQTGELVVTRGDNSESSIVGVTFQIGKRPGSRVRTVVAGESLQTAIDNAGTNDLILVGPGVYEEMVIMWKPVQLQGWGEGSTAIKAIQTPAEKLVSWREHIDALNSEYDIVDGQDDGFGGVQAGAFDTEEGAAVLVVAKKTGSRSFTSPNNRGARIDGFTIRGSLTGGGVVANGFVDYMDVSNNRITGNSGFFGGGVRVGHPFLTFLQGGDQFYSDSDNDFINIRYNQISQNGGQDGAGGGVSLYNGSDNYEVSNNFVCGNYSLQSGGGIAHFGLSDNGVIQDNNILFNENFNQGIIANGGGISLSGLAPLGDTVTPGTGSVRINRNLIQGNSAGSGDGGGIRLDRVNGEDVANAPDTPASWYTVDIENNMIFNNVAALAGGGISLQDAVRASILNNTIANNNNTSTATDAFSPGVVNQSSPQAGAGVVSRANSIALANVLPASEPGFSDPLLVDNIIWHNRSFYFLVDDTDPNNVLTGLCPDIGNSIGLSCAGTPVYDDIAVLPLGADRMTPVNSLLTDTTGYEGNGNISGPPVFIAEYVNGDRTLTITNPAGQSAMRPGPAFDEGGNFIRVSFGPLSQTRVDNGQLYGDYHVQPISPVVNAGTDAGVVDDFDGEPRPSGVAVDIGADEVPQVGLLELARIGVPDSSPEGPKTEISVEQPGSQVTILSQEPDVQVALLGQESQAQVTAIDEVQVQSVEKEQINRTGTLRRAGGGSSAPQNVASILHYVFYDSLKDGKDNGSSVDPPVNGATVRVFDEHGTVVAVQETGKMSARGGFIAEGVAYVGSMADGYAYFTGLPKGGEYLVEVDPSTVTQTDNPHFTLSAVGDQGSCTTADRVEYELASCKWYQTDTRDMQNDVGTEQDVYLTWHGLAEKQPSSVARIRTRENK